jgi:hypothetical protein
MTRLDASEIKAMHTPASEQDKPAPEEALIEGVKPQYRSAVKPATGPQISFLKDLYAQRTSQLGNAPSVEEIVAKGSMTVSHWIDKLKAMPKDQRSITKKEAVSFIPRPNQYGGICDRCEIRVEPMEGVLSKADDGKWIVSHKDGECPASEFPFPLGRYAVDTEEGHLAFYVARQGGLYVQASDILHRVPGNAQQAIIDKIAADPEGASKRYGRELGQCGVCGRILTDEISRAEGIGPICAARGF